MSHHARGSLPGDDQSGDQPSPATRWDVERAVMASDLPANARLVALVLCAATARGTVVVPPEFSPSLDRLASRTGLGRATVARELNRLEAGGWAIRHRASGVRTWYTLAVPTSPTAGRVPERDGYQSHDGTGTRPAAGPNQKCSSEGSSAAAAELSDEDHGDALDEHEPGTGQTGHDQAPAVEVDPHGDDVQALTAAGGVPASWEVDVRAALDRGCTVGQILEAYRAPITSTVRNPAAVRRTRIRDLAPEPARPAAPTVAVPPNVRSMCRQHGLPGPCPVCADLEATRATAVLDEGQVPAVAGGLEEPASVVLSAVTVDTLTAVRTRLPKQVGPGRRRRR